MYRLDGALVLSATDLSNFLGCRHRTALDMAVAYGERKRPHFEDPLLEVLGLPAPPRTHARGTVDPGFGTAIYRGGSLRPEGMPRTFSSRRRSSRWPDT